MHIFFLGKIVAMFRVGMNFEGNCCEFEDNGGCKGVDCVLLCSFVLKFDAFVLDLFNAFIVEESVVILSSRILSFAEIDVLSEVEDLMEGKVVSF